MRLFFLKAIRMLLIEQATEFIFPEGHQNASDWWSGPRYNTRWIKGGRKEIHVRLIMII
jgi:hypothetical protein